MNTLTLFTHDQTLSSQAKRRFDVSRVPVLHLGTGTTYRINDSQPIISCAIIPSTIHKQISYPSPAFRKEGNCRQCIIENRSLPRLPFNLAHTENTPHKKTHPECSDPKKLDFKEKQKHFCFSFLCRVFKPILNRTFPIQFRLNSLVIVIIDVCFYGLF